eukprot:CAMPEP_0181174502 /NCGR_PEP_ID=MMETSP1096-20121128/3573_1 /TAXON_ID=156174 ORGANISM="Chrysochromulina ericina, Strain CCMP281" /NCGR_SAMPLE_ID=MMETSP1096 /ASSEMBLY_ACC=CAM_ASM_000453 /LENGTH=133 /DNA_ID=CAMNT_0023262413 /DNA_START=198 /DNA_END=596 /DNA_ORIENTATION=+
MGIPAMRAIPEHAVPHPRVNVGEAAKLLPDVCGHGRMRGDRRAAVKIRHSRAGHTTEAHVTRGKQPPPKVPEALEPTAELPLKDRLIAGRAHPLPRYLSLRTTDGRGKYHGHISHKAPHEQARRIGDDDETTI